jgi:hypothetical protein
MRDLYGDSVYDYVAHVEWVDGEAFLFDIGRVGIDLSLEAFLGRDNCVLLDWFKTQAPRATTTTTTTVAPTTATSGVPDNPANTKDCAVSDFRSSYTGEPCESLPGGP